MRQQETDVEQVVERVLSGEVSAELVLLDLPASKRDDLLAALRSLDRPVLSTPVACG
jgi:hypothetical protein